MIKLLLLSILPWVGFILLRSALKKLGVGKLLNPSGIWKTGKKAWQTAQKSGRGAKSFGRGAADLLRNPGERARRFGEGAREGYRSARAAGQSVLSRFSGDQDLYEKRLNWYANTKDEAALDRAEAEGGAAFRAKVVAERQKKAQEAMKNAGTDPAKGSYEKFRNLHPDAQKAFLRGENGLGPIAKLQKRSTVDGGRVYNTADPTSFVNALDVDMPEEFWEAPEADQHAWLTQIGMMKGLIDANGNQTGKHLEKLSRVERGALAKGETAVLDRVHIPVTREEMRAIQKANPGLTKLFQTEATDPRWSAMTGERGAGRSQESATAGAVRRSANPF